MRLLPDIADLVVTDADGFPLLAVEVRNIPGLDAAHAQQLRDSILEDLEGKQTRFWMIVNQDRAFLWHSQDQAKGSAPAIEFSFVPMVERFVVAELRGQRLPEGVLSVIVWRWLLELTTANIVLPDPLVPAGTEPLWRELRGGNVVTQRAA